MVVQSPISMNTGDQVIHVQNEWQGPEIKAAEIVYPESDGRPMGETGFHVRAILHLYNALIQFFRDHDDLYVAADMFLYYEQGNPRANKAPDVMVIKGVSKHERRTFKIWEELARPCVVFEITSEDSMVEDMVRKSKLYAALGIQEYFLFDPLQEYLKNSLLGFRLEEGEYVPLLPDNNGRLFSAELGIFLNPEGAILRVIDPDTGKPVPSLDEAVSQAEQEAQRAEQEAQRAEQEAQRAEQEAQRAEQEHQRAERLAAQLRAIGMEPNV